MAIPIEGYTVIVKKDRIEPLIDSGEIVPPNATPVADDDLWRCSFMTEADATRFLRSLEQFDLNASQGPDPDAILVDEFAQAPEPYCEWLSMGPFKKAVIGWRTGTEPRSIIAKEGWNHEVGSGLNQGSEDFLEKHEFVRLDGNVEVYRNLESGELVYVGRTQTPVKALFKTAAAVIEKHWISATQPPLQGEAVEAVREANEMLERVLAEAPDFWNAHWFYGKGLLAVGEREQAYTSLCQAFELGPEVEFIPQELSGLCLQLGKFDEAAKYSEKAVSLEPDNAELLSNLALSYLMSGRHPEATKTIARSLELDPNDSIAQVVDRLTKEVVAGKRPPPRTMEDLQQPLPKKKKPFWKFW